MVIRRAKNGYTATFGCNRLIDGYQVEGDKIEFTSGAATRMAWPPPLHEMEGWLLNVLGTARSWPINGQVLELFDGGGGSIATFEAVYLR